MVGGCTQQIEMMFSTLRRGVTISRVVLMMNVESYNISAVTLETSIRSALIQSSRG